jgi:predicted transcriptional regulator
MDTIIRLLVLNAVEGKQLKDQVSILSSFGFQPKQIAEMLGKTPNNVSVILHRLREERGEPEVEEVPEEAQAGRAGDEQHA